MDYKTRYEEWNAQRKEKYERDIASLKKNKGGMIVLVIIIVVIFAYIGKKTETPPTVEMPAQKVDISKNEPANGFGGAKEQSQNENSQPIQKTMPTPEVKIPKYEVAHEVTQQRYDKGVVYYILINPIDLSSSTFKDGIKSIVKKMVEEKGGKISIHVYDKKTALETGYKQYGDMSLDRPLTKQENDEASIHNVGIFSGELKTGAYLNTLMFFPATFTDNPKVGKYVETVEFNPAQ